MNRKTPNQAIPRTAYELVRVQDTRWVTKIAFRSHSKRYFYLLLKRKWYNLFMNGFMELIPTQKLFEMMRQAEEGRLEASEALIRHELNRRLSQVAMDATGVYNASEDVYSTTEHPEDDRWIIKGEK